MSAVESLKYSKRFRNFKVEDLGKYNWYWIALAKVLRRYCKHSIHAESYANFYSE